MAKNDWRNVPRIAGEAEGGLCAKCSHFFRDEGVALDWPKIGCPNCAKLAGLCEDKESLVKNVCEIAAREEKNSQIKDRLLDTNSFLTHENRARGETLSGMVKTLTLLRSQISGEAATPSEKQQLREDYERGLSEFGRREKDQAALIVELRARLNDKNTMLGGLWTEVNQQNTELRARIKRMFDKKGIRREALLNRIEKQKARIYKLEAENSTLVESNIGHGERIDGLVVDNDELQAKLSNAQHRLRSMTWTPDEKDARIGELEEIIRGHPIIDGETAEARAERLAACMCCNDQPHDDDLMPAVHTRLRETYGGHRKRMEKLNSEMLKNMGYSIPNETQLTEEGEG